MPDSAGREVWGLDPTSACGGQPGGQIGACVCGVGSWRRPDGGAGEFPSEKETRSDEEEDVKKWRENPLKYLLQLLLDILKRY